MLQGVPVKVMRKCELEIKPEDRLQSEIQIVKGVQGVQVRLQCVQDKMIQFEGDRFEREREGFITRDIVKHKISRLVGLLSRQKFTGYN